MASEFRFSHDSKSTYELRDVFRNLTSIGVLAQIIEYNTSKLGSKMFQAKSKKPARYGPDPVIAWSQHSHQQG
ncbi:unnamed protein product [Caenorhabditis sp. 36 PRJEB53466]|nr:unnamed protein product [Caenorhabditis sp. 36 PRJEB53466]